MSPSSRKKQKSAARHTESDSDSPTVSKNPTVKSQSSVSKPSETHNEYQALLDKYGDALPVVAKTSEQAAKKEAQAGFRPKPKKKVSKMSGNRCIN